MECSAILSTFQCDIVHIAVQYCPHFALIGKVTYTGRQFGLVILMPSRQIGFPDPTIARQNPILGCVFYIPDQWGPIQVTQTAVSSQSEWEKGLQTSEVDN